jgi:hypothetical protein
MSTLSEIMTAMERLSPSALNRLRKHLDRLERKVWEKDLETMSAERKRRGITDRQIDEIIMRRRRESRR